MLISNLKRSRNYFSKSIRKNLMKFTLFYVQSFSDYGSDFKMVLVVRNDLKMGKGKIGAQCAHAAVGAYESATRKTPQIVRKWNNSGSMKIAVKVIKLHKKSIILSITASYRLFRNMLIFLALTTFIIDFLIFRWKAKLN